MAPAHHTTAKDRVYEYVKSGIIQLRFKEGEFIGESEIGNALGLSRTPVREALLLLEAENLVKLVPQKGAFIPPLSMRELEEVMETRQLIETCAADYLVGQPATIVQMRALVGEQTRVMESDNLQEFIGLDRQFHTLMVGATGNSILIKLYQGLRDRQMRLGLRAVTGTPGRSRKVLEEHETILVAAEARDVDALRTAVKSHLQNTLGAIRGSA